MLFIKVINISVLTDKIIRLGRRGEGNVRQIVFDCTCFEETYGSGTAQLLHWRRGDEAPYPVLIEQNEFLYSTGCRVSELVNVNKEDVNIKDGEVTLIGKGDKERKSYLTAHASLALQEYLKSRDDDNDALFVSKVKPHNRLKKGAIEKIIGELGVKAGIEKRYIRI